MWCWQWHPLTNVRLDGRIVLQKTFQRSINFTERLIRPVTAPLPEHETHLQPKKLVILREFEDRIFIKERLANTWQFVTDGSKYQLAI